MILIEWNCRFSFLFIKKFQDGVMAMRFHAAPNVYDTEGTCYCPDPDNCSPQGVFDLSPCAMGKTYNVIFCLWHFLLESNWVGELRLSCDRGRKLVSLEAFFMSKRTSFSREELKRVHISKSNNYMFEQYYWEHLCLNWAG